MVLGEDQFTKKMVLVREMIAAGREICDDASDESDSDSSDFSEDEIARAAPQPKLGFTASTTIQTVGSGLVGRRIVYFFHEPTGWMDGVVTKALFDLAAKRTCEITFCDTDIVRLELFESE